MDDPALQVDTSVFMDMTTSLGFHFVPVSDVGFDNDSYSATPRQIMDTILLPPGLGAACVLSDYVNATEYTDHCDAILRNRDAEDYIDGNLPVYPFPESKYL